MVYSPREKEARKRYKELLTEEGVSKASNYLGRVQTVLSDLARESGVLEAESLFAVESQEERERIRDWWVETGKSSIHDTATKTYMEKFIAVFWRLPLEQTRNRVTAQRLREPSHGLRLQTLFSAMAEHRGSETKTTVYENLISTLRRKPNCYVDSSSFKESESEFRAIRRDILAGLQKSYEVGSELKEIFSESARRAGMYKGAVYQCVMEHGHQILWDLSHRRLSFEDSILSPMAAICAHPTGDDTASMLELIRLVLEDSNAQGGWENPTVAPGEALKDPRLWESGLLEPWLEEKGGAAGRFAAKVLHARAMSGRKETFLRAQELFTEAIGLAEQNWEELKREWLDRLNREREGRLLPEDWWPAIPEEQMEGDFDRAVYPAELRISRAEVLTTMAGTLRDMEKDTRQYWLVFAQEELRCMGKALNGRVEGRQGWYEVMSGIPVIYSILFRWNLCRAAVSRLLALLEVEKDCLGDAVINYFAPAREGLKDAAKQLRKMRTFKTYFSSKVGEEMDKEITFFEGKWNNLANFCKDDFFTETSPVLRRMALRTQEDMADYRAEHERWKDQLGLDLRDIPKISQQIDPERLLAPEEFEPIYSSAFDSKVGSDTEHNKTPMELAILQLLGSSKTALLQLNQIVDNRSMLMMLTVPGFRQACRKGIVALSCYSKNNNPIDYLINALENRVYKFSSTSLYDLPKGAETMEGSVRKLMLDHLKKTNGVTLGAFPGETREEVEFLMECYGILEECFQPSDLRRYHQDNLKNQPNRHLASEPLNQVIRERLEAMDRAGKDRALMETLWAAFDECENATNRSIYDAKIKAMLGDGRYSEVRIEKFRKLVDQCYFFSNGRRSCKTVHHAETDPDLILPGDVLRVGDYRLDDIFYQHYSPGANSQMDWSDICRIAMTFRNIDCMDNEDSLEKRAERKEKASGFGFTVTQNDCILTDMTVRVASGQVIRVHPATVTDGETLGIHRQKDQQ